MHLTRSLAPSLQVFCSPVVPSYRARTPCSSLYLHTFRAHNSSRTSSSLMTMWLHLGRGHMLSLHFVQRRSLLGSPRRSLLQVQRSSQKRRQDIHLPARTCQPRRVHSRHLRRQHNLLCKRKRNTSCIMGCHCCPKVGPSMASSSAQVWHFAHLGCFADCACPVSCTLGFFGVNF